MSTNVSEKHNHDKSFNNDSDPPTSPSPQPAFGSSHHKHSLRGTKLARRARSFKDDLMEKFTQIRTPTNTLGRSHSPNSPRTKTAAKSIMMGANVEASPKPLHDLSYHVRQVKHALTHFKDVVAKNKLEMLSGNGTVVLETISTVLNALKSLHLNEHSSTLISATTQVHVSLGKLIKLCDEVLLSESGEENNASLSSDNVAEVVNLIDAAIHNLVKVANEQIAEREHNNLYNSSSNTLQRPQIDVAGQRTSLPDIPLTPSERDILEKSSSKNMRTSHSTESILRDSSPPPKPPLPHRSSNPPPLPPKRRSAGNNNNNLSHKDGGGGDFDSNMLSLGLDRMSMRSRSPDDNSSLLSASSLDSALNHSREDDEIRALTMGEPYLVEEPKDESEKGIDKYSRKNDIMEVNASNAPLFSITDTEFKNQRNSNESGFDSMHSIRSSTLSTSTRHASEHSIQQSNLRSAAALLSTASEVLQHSVSTQQNFVQQHHDLHNFSATSTTQAMQHMQHTVSSSSLSSSTNNATSSFVQQQQFIQQQQQQQQTTNSSVSIQQVSNAQSFQSFKMLNLASVGSGFSASNELFDEFMKNGDAIEQPPALPMKMRSVSAFPSSFEPRMLPLSTKHQSLCEQPPPLPVKKKHIMAYMEMFGNCSTEYTRHSVHTSCNLSINSGSAEQHVSVKQNHHISHSKTMSLSPLHKQTISEVPLLDSQPTITEVLVETAENPPALPPKRNRISSSSKPASISETPPVSPKLLQSQPNSLQHQKQGQSFETPAQLHQSGSPNRNHVTNATVSSNQSSSQSSTNRVPSPDRRDIRVTVNNALPVNGPMADESRPSGGSSTTSAGYIQLCDGTVVADAVQLNGSGGAKTVDAKKRDRSAKSISQVENEVDEDEVVLRHNQQDSDLEPPVHNSLIEELDILKYLVLKKTDEEGPEVKGGYPDALIVHATQAQKNSESSFGEAFITTYRTFMSPLELIEKLIHRYTLFCCQMSEQRAANEAFSLLVRVVHDLTAPDLRSQHLSILIEFVNQLVCSGQLLYAKTLREQTLRKIKLFTQHKWSATNPVILPSHAIVTNLPTLLELKSTDIAAQMTLLDAELFQKIEIPEVLIWAQEQCEERSPNLTQFTEHFNKMSYWARSQILRQEDAKDRERYVSKFIKIMKHLRKINNYNSYLALLSALDSAPIRRLEWHKTITEGLKEYCALIDSSSSFRAYRQALAETNPPCIPYIGLVLQDLTFVHIGNPDYHSDGVINFSKRWQQHNIVVNMKRFKKDSSYPFKKNERIISFFDNFENCLDEDAMWQISKNIKPRVSRKPIPT